MKKTNKKKKKTKVARLKKKTQARKKGKVSKKAPAKAKEKPKLIAPKPARFFEAIGRRKTAIARVRLFTQGEKSFLVNEKLYQNYFPTQDLQQVASASLTTMKCFDKFRILAKVKGGGIHAQAEALRHGIARALVLFNPNFRKRLKRGGYLTRDSRMRERKKFGLKRARRAPQWQKR